ncbi:MAG: HD family phosphohydrolase [Bacteroidota bacterium]
MKWLNQIGRFWKTIQIILIYTVAVGGVFLMYPQEGRFIFEYSKNKPWMHEDLIAPFDFPIYKEEAVVQHERDSLLHINELYFTFDTAVARENMKAYGQALTVYLDALTVRNAYPNFRSNGNKTLTRLMEEVLEKGIIELHPAFENPAGDKSSLMIIRNQFAEPADPADFYTPKSAFEYILLSLSSVQRNSADILKDLEVSSYLRPDIRFNSDMTEKVRNSRLNELISTQGMVQAGQIIISRGELVSPAKFQIIESLRKEYETNPNVKRNYLLIYIGQILLISLIFLSLLWFITHFKKDIRSSGSKSVFILALIVGMVGLTMTTVKSDTISYYVIPFVVVPIFLKTFFDTRFALFVHFLTILLAGYWVPNSYQFLLMNFLAGIVGVFSLRSYYRRGTLFYTAIFVILTYSVIFILLHLTQEGNLSEINWYDLLWFAGNGLLILTVYPLVFLFERLFGFLSDATLFELADTNQPLLRKLAEIAPGTFQHSMQVANLAEEAVIRIGGNPLLARTGALYHDIGKMDNPAYFIENQRNGENPHQKIDYRKSARIIIDHVVKGLEIARKYKLPEGIVDFIRTHHGTSTVQYFYKNFIMENPDMEVNVEEFTYPGPKPFSKETAIVMIADSVEAASRSLKVLNQQTIQDLVEKIVAHQTREEQFSDADLTFRDITLIKEIFTNKLTNMYHARIEYPA